MGLKLENGLKHQTEAINRINRVFENVGITNNTYKYANPLVDLNSNVLLQNIKDLNKELPSSLRGKVGIDNYLNIDIKMETGTGKTYVYTKMIYELNKNYGIHKFIILVPSLPIKLGTIKFLQSDETINHFKDQYGKTIDLCILNAKKNSKSKDIFPSSVRAFVEQSELLKDRITVLIANMHLFKEGNGAMLTKSYSSVVEDYDVPADAISATKPFLIIDEPHRISKDNKTFKFVQDRIKPQCIIRYGATFPEIKEGKTIIKDYHNLIYNLGSCEAFNDNLVKGVKVKYVDSPDGNNKKVKLLGLQNKTKARFELISEKTKKVFELEKDDSLKRLDDSFENITIDGIGKTLLLSNGQELPVGSEIYTDIYSTSYQTVMIQNALDSHFKTEKENFKRKDKIKTLSLFFIDDIDSYRENKQNPVPTYLKDVFEELLKTKIAKELDNIDESDSNELLYRDYLKATLDNIPACHGGYFSKDNNDSDDAIADEVRRILVDKDGTLSIYENSGKFNTFRFIFSKWTLKEGWDNPNIFTICKLRSSGSEISKLQEVGRGLRLPVNDTLSRVSNEQFYLNYIVDFTEKDFAYKLVNEINGDYAENTKLTSDIIKSVADSIGKTPNELFAALLTKGYIDMDKNIIVENRDSLFNEYPDLITGLKGKKIIDENNKEETPKAKIRVSKFKEIKDLWELLNRKYFISYTNITSDEIITNLLNILKDGVQGSSILIAHESTLINENGNIILSNDTNKEYENIKDNLQYNVFLNKLYQNTNIPINIIHKVLVEFNKIHKLDNNFFNTNTLTILTNRINEWKYGMLFGKFRYSSTTLSKEKTALTDSNGNPRVEVEGSLGISYSNQKPSEDYLYDICLYDSELEKKNITTDNDEVIVFGKIPARSIRIPLIGGGTYSPDFMYIVKKNNDVKEINLVIETKDYETEDKIPSDQRFEINCAREFFNKLNNDNYNVKYKVQLRTSQMIDIIKNL
jgi:type III restriction enzyme